MRAPVLSCLVIVACVVTTARTGSADTWRARPMPRAASCMRVADHVASLLAPPMLAPAERAELRAIRSTLASRCSRDGWAASVELCMATAVSASGAQGCLQGLSRTQQRALAVAADRLDDPRTSAARRRPAIHFAVWARRGTLLVRVSPPAAFRGVMLASDTLSAAALQQLHAQGLAAYQAGNFALASQRFEAAIDEQPDPGLVYHAAQAARLSGDWRRALELYEQYLEIAPGGPAAAACRFQVERLGNPQP